MPFGIRDGRLFEPLQVERGKACGCTCPGCGAALIAKHAPAGKVSPHFAHAYSGVCNSGLESALHLAAKQLIAERKQLYLPKLEPRVVKIGFGGVPVERKTLLFPGVLTTLSDVRLEVLMNGIRPDLVVTTQYSDILVEIACTSFVSYEKLEKIKLHGKPVLEFDVSSLIDLGFRELEAILFEPSVLARWVWHPQGQAETLRLTELVKAHIEAGKASWDQVDRAAESFQSKVDEDLDLMGDLQRPVAYKNRHQETPKRSVVSHVEQVARMKEFSQLSCEGKVHSAVKAMGDVGAQVRELLPMYVRSSNAIGGATLAWQAPVFAYFVHKAMKRSEIIVDVNSVRGWIGDRFSVSDDKAVSVAVWDFLKGLEGHGILHRKIRQEFIVLAPDLLGALAVARDNKTGECEPLTWVNAENAWPSREKSRAVAKAFTAAFGQESGWYRIAGLLPAVCVKEAPESTVNHYFGAEGLDAKQVRRYLIATGFVF